MSWLFDTCKYIHILMFSKSKANKKKSIFNMVLFYFPHFKQYISQSVFVYFLIYLVYAPHDCKGLRVRCLTRAYNTTAAVSPPLLPSTPPTPTLTHRPSSSSCKSHQSDSEQSLIQLVDTIFGARVLSKKDHS